MPKHIDKVRQAQNLAQGGVLFAPAGFKTVPVAMLLKHCNGCGAANAKFDFVPDTIYGTYIGDACMIHDFMYSDGVTIEDKEEADRVFLNNLLRIMRRDKKWFVPGILFRTRIKSYYNAVKYFGGSAFWDGKGS